MVTAVAGSGAVLPCYTSLDEPVLWSKYVGPTYPPFSDIFVSGQVINGFVERFSVDTRVSGYYMLVISNSTIDDSGLYVCVEDNGLEENHFIRLTVKGIHRSLSYFARMLVFVQTRVPTNCWVAHIVPTLPLVQDQERLDCFYS